MVLCVELVDSELGRDFRAFLDEGGYQARERSDGRREFYRFHSPPDQSLSYMIEIFARRPVDLDLHEDSIYTFKARTVLDPTARSEEGANVDRSDIRKHRNDVFRLAQLLLQNARVALPETVRRDLCVFVDLAHADQTLDPRAFHGPIAKDGAVDLLRTVHGLT